MIFQTNLVKPQLRKLPKTTENQLWRGKNFKQLDVRVIQEVYLNIISFKY